MELKKFHEGLIGYLLREYDREVTEDEVKEENGIYGLAYTTSEDDTEEYQLNFDINKMEMLWLINEKVVATESYTEEEILDLLDSGDPFEVLSNHCYEDRD